MSLLFSPCAELSGLLVVSIRLPPTELTWLGAALPVRRLLKFYLYFLLFQSKAADPVIAQRADI